MLILNIVRLQTVIGNPCDPADTDSYQLLGGRPNDVIDWLQKHRLLDATNIQPVSVGGRIGKSVDVTVKGDPGQDCHGLTGDDLGSVGLYATTKLEGKFGWEADGVHRIHDGEMHRLTVVDVGDDSPLMFNAQCHENECPTLLPWAQDFIGTISLADSE